PLAGGLRERLRDGIDRAERGTLAQGLHELCEQMRPLYGMDSLPADDARAVAEHCRAFWENRELIVGRLGRQATPEEEERVRADLLDLAILWTDLRVRLAPAAGRDAARREALLTLEQAEVLFGPSRVLQRERRAHALALGRSGASLPSETLPPRGAWEH